MNIHRLIQKIDELAALGKTGQGGCRRIALTQEDKLGRDWAVARMKALGLEVKVDRIGNINEEGVRFMPDMMGSLVYAGGYPLDDALNTVGTDGVRLQDALQQIGYAGSLGCGEISPAAFVELHIEQGPLLEAEGITIGAVQDLQGISWTEVQISGQSNHAGTTPMYLRRDAAYAAARITTFVRELAQAMGGAQVATVGSVRLKPNLINVIAGAADMTVDLRNTDEALLKQAEAHFEAFLRQLALEEKVQISTKRLARFEPVQFDPRLVKLIEQQADTLGYSHKRMTSGAGHDAQMMARLCPTAMIFVPSVKGISHNPTEHTAPEDLGAGAQVFYNTMLQLAMDVGPGIAKEN